MLMEAQSNGLLITPRLEIIKGMLDKCGIPTDGYSQKDLIEFAAERGLYTPIRLRNLLAQGKFPYEPAYAIVDECHHDAAQSYQDISMYLNGIPKIGLTATPFRGTPKSTREFLAQWNDTVTTILTLKQAIDGGYCSLPDAVVWPLIDDDTLKIVNGEFDSKDLSTSLIDVEKRVVANCKKFMTGNCLTKRKWDRATMFSVPSVEAAKSLQLACVSEDIPAQVVTGDTPYNIRQRIFKDCIRRELALIQINVVSEGVDLPVRRLIDCSPTMSPVRWQQQIGRIMRPLAPGENPPEYYTVCRNLERHGYLMEGTFPDSRVIAAQNAFAENKMGLSTKSTMRSPTLRVLGNDSLTKYVVTPVKLKNGMTVYTYHLNYTDRYKRTEYFVIVHPNSPTLIVGMKESTKDLESHELRWGKWKLINDLPNTNGFTTVKQRDGGLSDAQMNKLWLPYAERKGIDVHQKVNTRILTIVPFLLNTGMRL